MSKLVPAAPGGRPAEAFDKPKKRKRTSQACLACRRRKSRCNGARPACSSCDELDIPCEYVVPNEQDVQSKDRYLETLENRLASLETKLSDSTALKLPSNISASLGTESSPQLSDGSPFILEHEYPGDPCFGGSISAPYAEPADDDLLLGNGDAEGGQVGYSGPSSLLSYAHTISAALKCAIGSGKDGEQLCGDPAIHARSGGLAALTPSHSAFIKERRTIPMHHTFMDVTSLPDHSTAIRLIESYLDHIGALFPYLHRQTFLATYTQLRAGSCRIRRTWLAILNLILALALQRASVPGKSSDQRYEDSRPYYQRATTLYDRQMKLDTSLESVQYLLLLTQYLQGTSEAVLTWATHSRAVQSALQIGLHSQQINEQYSPLEGEVRRRTWYTCFILDKTLSMAFGRPPTIHESFMRISDSISYADLFDAVDQKPAIMGQSAEYFTSTVSMFAILGSAVELLYGNNLGFGGEKPALALASDVLQVEQQLHVWKRALPSWLQPMCFTGVYPTPLPSHPLANRLQTITYVRYNYMRALIHRPVVIRLLSQESKVTSTEDVFQLRNVGLRSLEACAEASANLIDCVHTVCEAHAQKSLLGTWWCSLYFTFTAALNLFSACLIHLGNKATLGIDHWTPPLLQLRSSFQQAIKTLEILDEGNSAVLKCIICLRNLDVALNQLYNTEALKIVDRAPKSLARSVYDQSEPSPPILDDKQGGYEPEYSYADFQEVFDQDLTFLNDMVF